MGNKNQIVKEDVEGEKNLETHERPSEEYEPTNSIINLEIKHGLDQIDQS